MKQSDKAILANNNYKGEAACRKNIERNKTGCELDRGQATTK
jgi:hypothetical protein